MEKPSPQVDMELSAGKSVAAGFGLLMIRFYQRWISPLLGANCRFRPTCSQYTYEAIGKYGFIKGACMGLWRILRCNPFSRGGDDPLQ
ncbi:MAG: hypothetical protein Kow0029_26970 [Candidatus Rifleibacteriota bacterium]